MNESVEPVTVDTTNVEEHGFFCYKSKPKSPGYQRSCTGCGNASRRGSESTYSAKAAGRLGSSNTSGRNAIWHPDYNPNRNAEIEALHSVPQRLWTSSRNMTLYTMLEPCLMCTGAILLHQIGRVLYGSADPYGGASTVIGHMPTYFEEAASRIEWIVPAYAEACDKLLDRVMVLVEKRRDF